MNVISQTAECLKIFILYILICVAVFLPAYLFCHIPKYIFRKMLHFIAFSCVTVIIAASRSWQAAVLTDFVIAAAAYPILALLECRTWFAGLFVQKSTGEVKRSLLMLFFMAAAVTAVSWGLFDNAAVGAAAILMWGIGDAAAALIGIPFGKHKVTLRFTDGKKSWEGSCAMLLAAFLSGFAVLHFYAEMSYDDAAICAIAGAAGGAAAELFSPSEYDTVSVPPVILAVLLAFLAK